MVDVTIVIVDNQEIQLRHSEQVLGEIFPSAHIVALRDPLLAIRYICSNPVDMVITAMDTRPLDGTQLAGAVKRIDQAIRVYILSDGDNWEEEILLEDEVDGFLRVPLSRAQLRALE